MDIYVCSQTKVSRHVNDTKEKGTHLCIELTAVYCHCAGRPFLRNSSEPNTKLSSAFILSMFHSS